MNNIVGVDYHNLFIYLDFKYLYSSQDITILHQSKLHKN
jgi:hypothetical protein